MRWIKRLKLAHQIFLILLSIPLFLVVSFLYYSATQHVSIQNKPLEQLAASTSATVAEKTDRNFNDRYADVKAFAFTPWASGILQEKEEDTLSAERFMNSMIAYYQCYDLMMLCDLSGKVILTNTHDRANLPLNTAFLKNKNMNDQEWFRSSIVVGGPAGGAYVSDFNKDEDIMRCTGTPGYGLDFSAPVRNQEGQIIGVWRTRVSWKAVTQQIRKESEDVLKEEVPGSLLLLMDKQGSLIDADAENNILKVTIGKNNLFKNFEFEYAGIQINDQEYLYGWAESSGAGSYKGNKWNYLTLIPKIKFTDPAVYLHSDWTKLVFFSVSLLLIGIFLSFLFVRNFSSRINKIKQAVLKLSTGEPDLIPRIRLQDEIGEMSAAINTLSHNFKKMADFSSEIGNGNLNAQFTPLGEKDILGLSLLKMQENLETFHQEIARQKWISDSLSSLGEILRESKDTTIVCQKALSFLASSVQAHQAVFFIVKNNSVLPQIELLAGYALSQESFSHQPLLWGENYVGQCIKDNESIRIKDLPADYTHKINSGLGECIPADLMILPVRFNNRVLGAIEFSSIRLFEEHALLLLERSSEYLGSYLASSEGISRQNQHYEKQVSL